MDKKIVSGIFVILILGLLFGFPIYFLTFNFSKDIKHETDRWVIIQDYRGQKIAIEPTDTNVWNELQLLENTTSKYICGIVTRYDNYWGFRFEPSSIYIANISYEPQPVIGSIAGRIDYYLGRTTEIKIDSIQLFNHKFYGLPILIIDLVLTIITIISFSLFVIYSMKDKRKLNQLEEILLANRNNLEGITFDSLSLEIDISSENIAPYIRKKNLQIRFGLKLSENRVFFKELLFNTSINQVKDNLSKELFISQQRLSLDEYSKLSSFRLDLNEALLFFTNDFPNKEKQIEINQLLLKIDSILEDISIDEFS